MKRKCTVCGKEKNILYFSNRKDRKDKKSSECKDCHNVYSHNHYVKNKKKYLERNRKKIRDLLDFINKYRNKPCLDCKKTYPIYIMDFDHREGTHKIKEVTKMVWSQRFSKEKILKEIEKCDVVCSNCHRTRTYERKLRVSVIGNTPISEIGKS